MSKKIYLYSKDKKYKCAIELADACDRFCCPDHSMIILTEERPNGTYVIAQAKDKILETEKDKQIEELKQQLEEKEKEIEKLREWLSQCETNRKFEQEKKNLVFKELTERSEQLKSQPAEIVEKIKGRFLATCQIEQGNDEMIASFQTFNRCLDTILKEYQK